MPMAKCLMCSMSEVGYVSQDLIDMLCLWWRCESQWMPVAGYPHECPSTHGYRASRQHDDGNGAFETDERGRLAISIGEAVQRVPEPHRTALYFLARNRATGAQVWMSPRLPIDPDERAEMVSAALEMFGREV